MARKATRRIAITLGVVLGLVVVISILVPVLVPREKIRSVATERLREATGGDVALGEVTLKVWPRLRLVLGESRVAVDADGLRAAGNDPGPLQSAEITLDRFEVDLALGPLLRKELEFGTVRLVKPEATVVTVPPAETEDEAPGGETGGGEPSPAWGLALATVEVRDGRLVWQESETGRRVAVIGWRQDLAASEMGVLLARLQRLGEGGGPVADEPTGPVALRLETQIERVELAGFGEEPMPPLTSLRLVAEIDAAAAADAVVFRIDELSADGGLTASASGRVTSQQLVCETVSLTVGEAARIDGSLEATLAPEGGPLAGKLSGRADLAALPAVLEPWLPARPDDQPPPPELSGNLEFTVDIDLDEAPPLEDAAAWQSAIATGRLTTVAAVAKLRDGGVVWREPETGRQIAITGWQQDLSAPELGVLLARLQRLGEGGARVAGEPTGPVSVQLVTKIDRLELAGFSEQPIPPFTSLRLTGAIDAPFTPDAVGFQIDELSADGGLKATARGRATLQRLFCENVSLAVGEAARIEGRLEATLPPEGGPLVCDLSGRTDLGALPAALEPWLPPRPDDEPPPPEVVGDLEVTVDVDLADAPPLADAAAWQEAIKTGRLGSGKATVTAAGQGLTVTAAQLGEPLRIGRLDYTGRLVQLRSPQRLRLGGLEHPGIRGDAEVEVFVGNDTVPHVVTAHVHELDLDAWTEIAEQARRGQQARADARWSLVAVAHAAEPEGAAPGELIPEDLHATVDLRADRALLMQTPYTAVHLVGSLKERVITVDEMAGRLGEGTVTGQARIDYATDPHGAATYDLALENAPASLLLAPYLPQLAQHWDGAISGQATGGCRLGEKATILETLSVIGGLSGTVGTIDLRDLLQGAAPYLGARQDLLRVTYNDLRQAYRIEDGKVHLESLVIDGGQTDWSGGGWLGLDGTLDVDLSVKLPPGFTPNLGDLSFVADALRDDEGRIGLDFSLTGRQQAPAFGLDLDPQALMQDKLGDEVKKGVGGLLDKLKGKK